MLNKVSLKKPAGDIVENEQDLRTELFSCLELQSENSWPLALIQRHSGSNHARGLQHKHMWHHSFVDKTKSENYQFKKLTPILMHSVKGSELQYTPLQHSKLKDLYHHFKQDSISSADAQEKHCCNVTKISHHILEDKFGCSENSEIMMEKNFKVQSFERFPSADVCDMNELISISDCVYNQEGQLVRMFVCFEDEHSDTSSVASSSDSGCSAWDSDCDDFIVFENSCTDNHTRCDFVCEASEFHNESQTCAKSVVLTSNMYCEVSVMETFDNQLDSFVQEILQPNLHYGCDEFIWNRTSSKDLECKSSSDFISTNTTAKTVSKEKRKKKVQFMPDNQLAVVHPMIVWNFAYRQARKGSWEADALDRLRFQKRVKELDEILTPVLLAKKEKISVNHI